MVGEKESRTAATEEAGDCLARSLDRNLCTRYLYGIGFGKLMGHESEGFD